MADEPTKLGRPTKLTPEVQARLVDLLKQGASRQAAAAAAGIAYSTLKDWVARGEDRHPERDSADEFVAFAAALHAAEAEFEQTLLRDVQTYAGGGDKPDWRGPAWLLERRFPDRWGARKETKVELTGKDGGPVQVQQSTVDLNALSNDQLRRLAAGEPLESVLGAPGPGGPAPPGAGAKGAG